MHRNRLRRLMANFIGILFTHCRPTDSRASQLAWLRHGFSRWGRSFALRRRGNACKNIHTDDGGRARGRRKNNNRKKISDDLRALSLSRLFFSHFHLVNFSRLAFFFVLAVDFILLFTFSSISFLCWPFSTGTFFSSAHPSVFRSKWWFERIVVPLIVSSVHFGCRETRTFTQGNSLW